MFTIAPLASVVRKITFPLLLFPRDSAQSFLLILEDDKFDVDMKLKE